MAISQEEHLEELSKGYRFDWKDADHSVFEPKRGLSAAVVEEISALKSEPDWMKKYRLKALKHFEARRCPGGAPTCPRRLQQHLLLHPLHGEAQAP